MLRRLNADADPDVNERHTRHEVSQVQFISEITGCQSVQTRVTNDSQLETDQLYSIQRLDLTEQCSNNMFVSQRAKPKREITWQLRKQHNQLRQESLINIRTSYIRHSANSIRDDNGSHFLTRDPLRFVDPTDCDPLTHCHL